MTTTINASTSAGLVQTADTSGALALQTAGTTALTINSSQVVNFANAPTVAGGAIVSAATPTVAGTVFGSTLSSGTYAVALGSGALAAANTGVENTAIGRQALTTNTSGASNTAIGYAVLYPNTTGSYNVSTGAYSLRNNTTGSENVASGYSALNQNTTASYNVAYGSNALYANTTGAGNVAIGQSTGSALTTGSYNIYIGYQTGNGTKTSGVDCIYIGRTITPNNAGVNGEMVINTNGNNATGKGDGTGLITTGGNLYNGLNTSAWQTISDRRLKKNIVDNTEGLDVISQIRVRNFEYKLPEEITELQAQDAIQKSGVQLGVIAQELQEVCSDCVKEETTGVLSVNSDNLTWHMVNAIKDLKALNNTQAATINALTARIVALEK